MNTANNRRRKDSQTRLENAFIHLLEHRDIADITVTDLCQAAQVNRSTFYSNYEDIYHMAVGLQQRLAQEVLDSFRPLSEGEGYEDRCMLALFHMIRDNQNLFKACFQLGIDQLDPQWPLDAKNARLRYNNQHLDYHVTFFRAGLNAIIRHWLELSCAQDPEELLDILHREYGVL